MQLQTIVRCVDEKGEAFNADIVLAAFDRQGGKWRGLSEILKEFGIELARLRRSGRIVFKARLNNKAQSELFARCFAFRLQAAENDMGYVSAPHSVEIDAKITEFDFGKIVVFREPRSWKPFSTGSATVFAGIQLPVDPTLSKSILDNLTSPNSIRDLKRELRALDKQVYVLNNQLNSCRSSAKRTLAAAEAKIEQQAKVIAARKTDIAKMKVDAQEKADLLKAHKQESLAERRELAEAAQAKADKLKAKLAEASLEATALEEKLAQSESRYAILLKKFENLEREHNDPVDELRSMKKQVADLSVKFEAASVQLETIKEQHRKAVPTQDVIARIGNDIAGASQQMKGQRLPFTLAKTKINLKAVLSEDGGSLHLPTTIHEGSDGAISEIELEILPAVDQTVANNTKVPSLIGLTKSAVERLVRDAGLKLVLSHIPVTRVEQYGRAAKQFPDVGTTAIKGAEILVAFGTAESVDEQ